MKRLKNVLKDNNLTTKHDLKGIEHIINIEGVEIGNNAVSSIEKIIKNISDYESGSISDFEMLDNVKGIVDEANKNNVMIKKKIYNADNLLTFLKDRDLVG